MMKNSRLFGLIAVLGVVFLAMFGVFRIAKEYRLIVAPIADIIFLLVPISVGAIFFTVGICEIGIDHLKLSEDKRSKALYSVLVLFVAFFGSLSLCYIFCSYFSALVVTF
jgi:hypothetical protein